jgi:hypothetical protein
LQLRFTLKLGLLFWNVFDQEQLIDSFEHNFASCSKIVLNPEKNFWTVFFCIFSVIRFALKICLLITRHVLGMEYQAFSVLLCSNLLLGATWRQNNNKECINNNNPVSLSQRNRKSMYDIHSSRKNTFKKCFSNKKMITNKL